MNDYWDRWYGFVTIAILMVAFIFGGAVGIWYGLASWECRQYGDQFKRPHEFHFPAGCFLELDGKQVPLPHYIYMEQGGR